MDRTRFGRFLSWYPSISSEIPKLHAERRLLSMFVNQCWSSKSWRIPNRDHVQDKVCLDYLTLMIYNQSLAMFFNKEKLTLEETFCFTKSKHAEVKLNPKKKILEILPKTVSAFAQKSLRAWETKTPCSNQPGFSPGPSCASPPPTSAVPRPSPSFQNSLTSNALSSTKRISIYLWNKPRKF